MIINIKLHDDNQHIYAISNGNKTKEFSQKFYEIFSSPNIFEDQIGFDIFNDNFYNVDKFDIKVMFCLDKITFPTNDVKSKRK